MNNIWEIHIEQTKISGIKGVCGKQQHRGYHSPEFQTSFQPPVYGRSKVFKAVSFSRSFPENLKPAKKKTKILLSVLSVLATGGALQNPQGWEGKCYQQWECSTQTQPLWQPGQGNTKLSSTVWVLGEAELGKNTFSPSDILPISS